MAQGDRIERLITITGVDLTIAAGLVAAIGDIRRWYLAAEARELCRAERACSSSRAWSRPARPHQQGRTQPCARDVGGGRSGCREGARTASRVRPTPTFDAGAVNARKKRSLEVLRDRLRDPLVTPPLWKARPSVAPAHSFAWHWRRILIAAVTARSLLVAGVCRAVARAGARHSISLPVFATPRAGPAPFLAGAR